jgi:glycosyltransferase involved in cell wall biosynthesis
MKISGFSFVRNGVEFDYPFLESITSLLPLCDELIIAVGRSDDDTRERIQSLGSPKIRIIDTVWDETLRTGGQVLAQQTDIALRHATGDWAFYLQADEVLHENDLPIIREAMLRYHADARVEGLLFHYNHFYGSYDYVGSSRQWYRREIRVVRNGISVRSWGDAQGFRIDGRKLRVKAVEASVYHYGWVKPPEVQMAKQRSFHRLWHPDEWIRQRLGESTSFDYAGGTKLEKFTGSHPAVMRNRIKSADWKFEYDPSRVRVPFKDALLEWIESTTGARIGEYKNYELI